MDLLRFVCFLLILFFVGVASINSSTGEPYSHKDSLYSDQHVSGHMGGLSYHRTDSSSNEFVLNG